MEILGYIGALIVGMILGLTGGGGSILTVPILVYLLAYDAVIAAAYSLFIVGITSTVGATINYFKGLVDLKTGFLFAIPSFSAVFLTRRYLVPIIPEVIFENDSILVTKHIFLIGFFAIVMLFAAYSMLKKPKLNLKEITNKKYITKVIIQNLIIGVVIGLIGAGGGFLIIPSLVLFAKLPMNKAVATSLFVISINSLVGFLGDVFHVHIDWNFLLAFSFFTILGIFIGISLSKKINENQLKKGFAYFVLGMAGFILLKEFYFV